VADQIVQNVLKNVERYGMYLAAWERWYRNAYSSTRQAIRNIAVNMRYVWIANEII
jgi:hypothetical protein